MKPKSRNPYTFHDFRFCPEPLELSRAGEPVVLQPQPGRLLELLVRRRGEIVSREQIRGELWPDGAFLDHDQAINFAIRKLRIALGDRADEPHFIETVPRLGYRFVAPVERPPIPEESPPGIAAADAIRPEGIPGTALDTAPRHPPNDTTDSLRRGPRKLPRPWAVLPLGAVLGSLAWLAADFLSPPHAEPGPAAEIRFSGSSTEPGSTASLAGTSDVETPSALASITGSTEVEVLDDTYLQARYLVEQETPEEVQRGSAKLREVIERSPDFAPAYSTLALAFFYQGRGSRHFASYMPKILQYADRALELDPDLAEGHWLRSMALFFHYHRWDEAEAAARRALALDPTFPDALQQVAVAVAARGRTAEAVELIRQALVNDPAGELLHSDLAFCLMYDRRFAEALDAIATNLEVAPDDPINLFLDASLRFHLGDREEALASFDRYLGRWWQIPEPAASFEGGVEALRARIEVLRRRGGRAHFPLALTYALVGQSQEALFYLAEACDHDPDWELPMVRVDPRFDAVRELPGFAELEGCFPPMPAG